MNDFLSKKDIEMDETKKDEYLDVVATTKSHISSTHNFDIEQIERQEQI